MREDPNWICGQWRFGQCPAGHHGSDGGGHGRLQRECQRYIRGVAPAVPKCAVFIEYDMHDPTARFNDNGPGPAQGRVRGRYPRASRDKGTSGYFICQILKIFEMSREVELRRKTRLDAVRKALPHKYARKKNFVYPCVRENDQNRVVLNSFQIEPNDCTLEQSTSMEYETEMADFVTGDASAGAQRIEYLNVDRDDLAASKDWIRWRRERGNGVHLQVPVYPLLRGTNLRRAFRSSPLR